MLGSSGLDLEATEMALRSSMHQIGGRLLERLLNAESNGHVGARRDCGHGHQAVFVDYRNKQLLTVLSSIELRRAYYYCECCGEGIVPRDRELDIVGTSFSPGVRRLMGQVGGKEAFEQGRRDLEELADIRVETKQVERTAESIGRQIEVFTSRERQALLAGKLVSMASVPKLYIAIDGTGLPVVARETEGRVGKHEGGVAKTREAKLACLFTQTGLDSEGRPVRDPGSTSYVGAIQTASAFGERLYAEALRRGVNRAKLVIVLGDGAPWIWVLAVLLFPGAVCIVDLYHAREHLADLAKLLYQPFTKTAQSWLDRRTGELDAGEIEQLVSRLRKLHPQQDIVRDSLRKAIGYFQENAERMRYARFREQGLFVGSGVVEAGCKSMGQRLKQSGMHWTVSGANAVIALRCCQLSGRWEEYWEGRACGQ